MLLVDASVYIFRAFHSLPSSLTGRDGQAVNAIYGYATFLVQLLEQDGDCEVAAVFDQSLTSSFRNLETMLADPDRVAASGLRDAKSLAGKLVAHADQARLSRPLATIVTDIDLDADQRDIARRTPDSDTLAALCEHFGLGERLRARLGLTAA